MISETAFADIPYDVIEKRELAFRCSCSQEKIERALISLGRGELGKMIEEHGGAEVKCEFCRKVYNFTKTELERLLNGNI